jgi:hypothetical protein
VGGTIMKIVSTILVALMFFIGGVVTLYGLFLGAVGILNAWLNKKGKKK